MGSTRIFSIAYIKTSALATALGRTINEGDIITKADLLTASLPWQKLDVSSSFDKLDFSKKPLTAKKSGAVVVDDFTQAGFADLKGDLEIIYNPNSTAVKHQTLLQNGFGTFVDNGDTSSISAVTDKTHFSIADSSPFSVGDLIKVGDNNHGLITAIAGNDITLENPINATVGDTVILSSYWLVKELETPQESFLLLIKTSFGYKVATFCRFNIGLKIDSLDLFKMNFAFMGDYTIEDDFDGYTPTILDDDVLNAGVTTAFSGSTFAGQKTCVLGFDFELKREGKRLKCNATEMRTGNGGVDASEYSTTLTANQYTKTLESYYKANTQFSVLTQKGELVIYLPACRIAEFNDLAVDDDLQIVEQKLFCNTDDTKDIKIILG